MDAEHDAALPPFCAARVLSRVWAESPQSISCRSFEKHTQTWEHTMQNKNRLGASTLAGSHYMDAWRGEASGTLLFYVEVYHQ